MTQETGAVNYRWSFELMEGLVASGVSHIVISPGARSTPLVLAADNHPALTTHVILDERSAAFFALGLSKVTNAPVALVCTSGSAPANWYPAILEADAGKIPLILLSADRPPELRGCGANQTTDQIKLFGQAVKAFHELPPAEDDVSALKPLVMRLVMQSRWPMPGPVHMNIPFREPLLPNETMDIEAKASASSINFPVVLPSHSLMKAISECIKGKPGFIVCGGDIYTAGFSKAVHRLATKLNVPILADPLANLRQLGGNVFAHYDSFLKNETFTHYVRPKWVLRFGAQPVSKSLSIYLSGLTNAEHFVVDSHAGWQDPLHLTNQVYHASPDQFCDMLYEQIEGPTISSEWIAHFQLAEKRCEEIKAGHALPTEADIISTMAAIIPEKGVLFSGNSTPIRHLDSFLSTGHNNFKVMCNRGLSGIDGCVSTAMGMGAGVEGPVVAFMGDLTLSHDLTALGLGSCSNMTLVVINNGGGGIFEYLPHGRLERPVFERYWLTPSVPDLEAASRAFGCRHHKVEGTSSFKEIFEQSLTSIGTDLIEVIVDRTESTLAHKAYWETISKDTLETRKNKNDN